MRDPEQGALSAVEWAIKKYGDKKSDNQIALGLNVDVEIVKQAREELGLHPQKGTESMKEFARRYLLEMSEPEKLEFIKQLDPDTVWEMAEGKAATTGELHISNEPQRIDITHHLLKVYGPNELAGVRTSTAEVLRVGESSQSTSGSDK